MQEKAIFKNLIEPNRIKRDVRPMLIFLNGDFLAVPIPLDREEITIGRALEANVRINDTRISRLHARITTFENSEIDERKYFISDLGSKNGTILNGQLIQEAWLNNGDKLEIGGHLLRFELLDEIDREYQSQIRRLLSHDDLTGLLSSSSFFSELRRETTLAGEAGRRFCVLMMDIDHFKLVNDHYGHLTGSKTLEEIGFCITRNLRTGDVGARFGGEEFAAFLLDADVPQAWVAAERIRSAIEKNPFTVLRHGKPAEKHFITVSIGISSYPIDATDPIELVELADSALYRAKREGRNRCCVYRDLTPEEIASPLPKREPYEA